MSSRELLLAATALLFVAPALAQQQPQSQQQNRSQSTQQGERNPATPGRVPSQTGGAVPGEVSPGVRPPAPGPVTQGGDNLQRLQQFQRSANQAQFETVSQEGRRADALRRNLENIRLPDGFRIELYAVVPDARHIAVGPSTGVVFVGTRKSRVWAITDRDRDRVADEVKSFAPSIQFSVPNGLCFSPDGILYVVEHNRVLAFPATEFFYEGTDSLWSPWCSRGS